MHFQLDIFSIAIITVSLINEGSVEDEPLATVLKGERGSIEAIEGVRFCKCLKWPAKRAHPNSQLQIAVECDSKHWQ